MKKLLVIIAIALVVFSLSACHSGSIATADQTAHKSTVDLPTPDQLPNKAPSRDGNLEKNDDPSPGTYAEEPLGLSSYQEELEKALPVDPMVLAEFLQYYGELDDYCKAPTDDKTADIDAAAKAFLNDEALRSKAVARAQELLSEHQSDLSEAIRNAVPLRSTDFSSYEEYEAYMERLRRLYAPSPAE